MDYYKLSDKHSHSSLDNLDEECPICFEEFNKGDIAILNCPKNHQFHFSCIGKWINNKNNNNKNTCPMCLIENVEICSVIKNKTNKKIIYNNSPPSYHSLNSSKQVNYSRTNEVQVDLCCGFFDCLFF